MTNKSTEDEHKLKTLVYRVDRTRLNIEEYFKVITESFTDLAHSGPSHKLNEHQKVVIFENILQNNSTVRYHIAEKIIAMTYHLPNRLLIDSTICSVLILARSNI